MMDQVGDCSRRTVGGPCVWKRCLQQGGVQQMRAHCLDRQYDRQGWVISGMPMCMTALLPPPATHPTCMPSPVDKLARACSSTKRPTDLCPQTQHTTGSPLLLSSPLLEVQPVLSDVMAWQHLGFPTLAFTHVRVLECVCARWAGRGGAGKIMWWVCRASLSALAAARSLVHWRDGQLAGLVRWH